MEGCNGTKQQQYNKFCDGVKQELWSIVTKNANMEKYMTNRVRQNFAEFARTQGAMDFTKENVANIIKTLFINRFSILDSAVVDVFDIFTQHHKENRYLIEGWKTNDKWKVNRKVILPYWISYGDYMTQHDLKSHGDRMKISHSRYNQYTDIDKVMCYLAGVKYEECYTLYDSLKDKLDSLGKIMTGDKFDNTGESQFFTYKFWRKGTLHIEFKDKWLWEKFNIAACSGKNWLPEHEKEEWEKKNSQRTEQPAQTELLQLVEDTTANYPFFTLSTE